jgi:hypothetical protein
MRDLTDGEIMAIAGGDGPMQPTNQGCYYQNVFYQPGQTSVQAGYTMVCTYSIVSGGYVWAPYS